MKSSAKASVRLNKRSATLISNTLAIFEMRIFMFELEALCRSAYSVLLCLQMLYIFCCNWASDITFYGIKLFAIFKTLNQV